MNFVKAGADCDISQSSPRSALADWSSCTRGPVDKATRLPVVDNDGRLVGVLNTVRALSDPDRATVDLMRQPLLLDANDSMLEAIDRLRSEGRGMGIVVKAGTLTPLGVVTVKDLVEPLTGELAAW